LPLGRLLLQVLLDNLFFLRRIKLLAFLDALGLVQTAMRFYRLLRPQRSRLLLWLRLRGLWGRLVFLGVVFLS
jgi:hypothetical protein